MTDAQPDEERPFGVPLTNRATRRACDHGQTKSGWCYSCGARVTAGTR